MSGEIRQLIETPFDIAPLSQDVVVYGAGNTGRAVNGYLSSAGHRVIGFLDAAARPGQQIEGIPVLRPEAWSPGGRADCDVLVAVHNFGVEMVGLQARVAKLGFRRTLNMIHFHNLFPHGQPFRYWLTDRGFYRGRAGEIAAAASVLGDATSRQWFNEVLAFRLTGDYSRLPTPKPAEQYFPADLPRWSDPLRFVDCGAFNGDTVDALARGGYRFDAIAAFEPDPVNYVALAARIGRYGEAYCFPCGVSDATRTVRFATGEGMASHESADGGTSVQCVALDDALPGFRPTLIKMDVEGAEPAALEGARKMIEAARPGLAIALYHEPSHLWEIPSQIASWGLDYRLEIRGHGHGSYDTVLYALPREATIRS
jgi:FkbM family methyltransferase